MARTEAEALRDESWAQSARPEIKQLMDSLLTTTVFLDVVARSPRREDLGPALDSITHYVNTIRRTL